MQSRWQAFINADPEETNTRAF